MPLCGEENFFDAMGKNTTQWRFISYEDECFLKVYEKKFADLRLIEPSGQKIPKKIHLIWIGPKNFPIDSLQNVLSWKKLHPDWDFYFWTDRKRFVPIDGLISRSIQDIDFKGLEKQFNQSINYAEKADILRYLILAEEGGIYIDHDAYCLQTFEELNKKYDFYTGLQAPHQPIDKLTITAGIGIIGAKKNHPIILNLLKRIKDNWDLVTEKFSGDDEISKYQLVMNRTYIHMTHALKDFIPKTPTADVVFPASYFYPIENMEGVYSKHLYANSWYYYGDYKKQKQNQLLLEEMNKQITHLWRWILFLLGLLIAFTLARYQIKRSRT